MPPIIEDYAAIKRRMEEIANPPKPAFVRLTLSGNGPSGGFIEPKGLPLFGEFTILTPEGKAFMEKNGTPLDRNASKS